MPTSRALLTGIATAGTGLALLTGCGGSSGGHAPDRAFGYSDNSVLNGRATPEQVAALAHGTGAGIVRFTLPWRSLEPRPNVYEWRTYDHMYKAFTAKGIRPLLTLMWAPTWALGPNFACGDCRAPPDPRFDAQWREVVSLLAKRYPRAAGIEIWNEPNEKGFWGQRPDGRRYAELLTEAYQAAKAANPSMRVVGGAVTLRQATDAEGNLGTRAFLDQMYAGGAKGHMDALSFHVYGPPGDLGILDRGISAVRDARDAAGDSDTPLWVTEFGFTTTGPDGSTSRVTEDEQARLLVDGYRALRERPDVQVYLVHTLIDLSDDPADPRSGFGIVRGNLSAKPAYCALARTVGVEGHCPPSVPSTSSSRP
jgi:polysaccharide biosynthesis protein PslG